jgi:hypothetical protein
MSTLTPPPPTFVATREALRSLACYAIAPARKARTGRIGLRPTGDGFATPPFDDGTSIVVRGDRLLAEPGVDVPITTLRAAADVLGVTLSADPGVGHDLPPFRPDEMLDVDVGASRWLGAWYGFGSRQLDRLASVLPDATLSEAQLWPEHFDLAVVVELDAVSANAGFSPGDSYSAEPYVYVSPFDRTGLTDAYWNAPFGAALSHSALRMARDREEASEAFLGLGLDLLRRRA